MSYTTKTEEKMKAGIEIIAETRKRIRRARNARMAQIIENVSHAEVCDILGNPQAGLKALAEAGALIAAEIDRINKLSTK